MLAALQDLSQPCSRSPSPTSQLLSHREPRSSTSGYNSIPSDEAEEDEVDGQMENSSTRSSSPIKVKGKGDVAGKEDRKRYAIA
jgi:hypothetical protein